MAKDCGESHIAEQCLCNSGIAQGQAKIQEKQKMFSTFYQGAKATSSPSQGGNGDEEEDEEWSEEEAEADSMQY